MKLASELRRELLQRAITKHVPRRLAVCSDGNHELLTLRSDSNVNLAIFAQLRGASGNQHQQQVREGFGIDACVELVHRRKS